MNAMPPFHFEGQSVRVVRDADGEPWFVAADVCRCLEIGLAGDAVRRLDADEKGMDSIHTPGGPQKMATVNEAGLYRLIFTSRKPSAERFKRWLAHDVLPALRRTGSYAMPGHAAEGADIDLDGIEVERLWLTKITVCRQVFGRRAAQWMWGQSPLPVPPNAGEVALPKGAVLSPTVDDALAVLHALLDWAPPRCEGTIADLLPLAANSSTAVLALKSVGIAVSPPGWSGYMAIAAAGIAAASVWKSTEWRDTWRDALLTLDGVVASPGGVRFGKGMRSRSIMVPLVLCRPPPES